MGRMTFPPLTHLQSLVIKLILSGRYDAPQIRDGLKAFGASKSCGAFYELMGRMEEAGLIAGSQCRSVRTGELVQRWDYAVTERGRELLRQTARFYMTDLDEPPAKEAA